MGLTLPCVLCVSEEPSPLSHAVPLLVGFPRPLDYERPKAGVEFPLQGGAGRVLGTGHEPAFSSVAFCIGRLCHEANTKAISGNRPSEFLFQIKLGRKKKYSDLHYLLKETL